MGLFPQTFIEDLRAQADIVQVVHDHVPLRRAGASYKGLCPFHGEKTPSFHVNREKGFFHCFGCGVGGDVFKFVELHDKVGFQDAVRQLAQRFGMAVPQPEHPGTNREDEALRETLLRIHDVAGAYFRTQLEAPSGNHARRLLRDRGLSTDTVERLGVGLAPPGGGGLGTYLLAQGFSRSQLVRSGLIVERDDGRTIDRFRNRIMFPICRESGTTIGFGGRAMDGQQQPKYLNSPETPIYTKGRTLYGLHLTKADVRSLGYAIVVEGYFDFAQVLQTGSTPVVATCGTALTLPQAKLLRRFAAKVILCFDADAAGQTASERSGDLLIGTGFQVNVVALPSGQDPDGFVQQHGGTGFSRLLKSSRSYLDYVLDRASEHHDLGSDEGRRTFLTQMLTVAARLPDAPARDQFADRIAHKARMTEQVVRAEIRRAAVEKRTIVKDRDLPVFGDVKPAEKGIIWALMRDVAPGVAAVAELEPADLEGLKTASILQTAHALRTWPVETLSATLVDRLTAVEADLVRGIAGDTLPPAPPNECVRTLKRLRWEREQLTVQREIDRLQEEDGSLTDRIDALWHRKKELLHRIETLNT